jgi:hypothetical protein
MAQWMRCLLLALAAIILPRNAEAQAPPHDARIQAGFRAMYSLDFAASGTHFADYISRKPGDPLGHAADAARVLFMELHRLGVLDAEFYVDDKKLVAETTGKPDAEVKRRMTDLAAKARKLAEDILESEPKNENALFALALANGVEADYLFLVEKDRRGAATPGRAGYDNAKRLLEANAGFHDAYIWTGVTNYVVASLPFPVRWLARLRGYPSSKDVAIKDLRSAAEKGSLLKPYAQILLAVTYLREKKTADAQKLIQELSREFPANPIFAKHAKRLAR